MSAESSNEPSKNDQDVKVGEDKPMHEFAPSITEILGSDLDKLRHLRSNKIPADSCIYMISGSQYTVRSGYRKPTARNNYCVGFKEANHIIDSHIKCVSLGKRPRIEKLVIPTTNINEDTQDHDNNNHDDRTDEPEYLVHQGETYTLLPDDVVVLVGDESRVGVYNKDSDSISFFDE